MKSLFCGIMLAVFPLHARELSGIALAEETRVDGHPMVLNGAGLRTATVLRVKIYVAAMYLPAREKNPVRSLADDAPKYFKFTFLRPVDEKRADEAWRYQFRKSSDWKYPGLTKDVETITTFFGPIKRGGEQSFFLAAQGTRVFENGVYKGTIAGEDFKKAFLSLWFGPRPVMDSLKRDLLNG